MQIRQLAVHYDPAADRLLMRVRAGDDSVFATWLTRRLCLRLWPHWQAAVQQVGAARALAAAAPRATATPQAARMLAEAERERSLQQSDFSQPFDAGAAAQQPLGPEPLLAHTVQLTPRGDGRLLLAIRDAAQRSLQLELDADLSYAMNELLRGALAQAEWGLALGAPPDTSAPPLLN